MEYRIKYELYNEPLPEGSKDKVQALELIGGFPWDEKYAIGAEEATFPSISIINNSEKAMLIITAVEKKIDLLFVVECVRGEWLAERKGGPLISDISHVKVIEIVEFFCDQNYAAIEQLDNSGFLSKLVRRLVFLFVSEKDFENLADD
ncbi:MAG: hypothetical protein AAF585_25380 [Verrucomicrobiota bacterium]